MLEDTSITTYAVAGTLFLLSVAALTFYPAKLVRWAQKKKYQYEVTSSLYMLTPTEKFVFNSVLFLLLSCVLIAASLYLPAYIATIARRTYYYAAGDGDAIVASQRLAETIHDTATKPTEAMVETVTNFTEAAKEVMESATAAAAERVATGGAAPEL